MTIHDEFSNAIEANDLATVESLLKLQPELANAPEWTPPPLHCAVLWNAPQVAELLLDHGADIELRDPDRQTTPLRYAIMYAREEMIRFLIARGASPLPLSENGTTACELAVQAADGAYDEFDDLPTREEYAGIVSLLNELGID